MGRVHACSLLNWSQGQSWSHQCFQLAAYIDTDCIGGCFCWSRGSLLGTGNCIQPMSHGTLDVWLGDGFGQRDYGPLSSCAFWRCLTHTWRNGLARWGPTKWLTSGVTSCKALWSHLVRLEMAWSCMSRSSWWEHFVIFTRLHDNSDQFRFDLGSFLKFYIGSVTVRSAYVYFLWVLAFLKHVT